MTIDQSAQNLFWRILTGTLISLLIAILGFFGPRLYEKTDRTEDLLEETDRTQEAVLSRLRSLETQAHKIDDSDRWHASEEMEFQKRYDSEMNELRRRIGILERNYENRPMYYR